MLYQQREGKAGLAPCRAAIMKPEGEKGSLSSLCSEPVDTELSTLPKGTEQSQAAGEAVPKQRSQGRDYTGSSCPKRQTREDTIF